MRENFLAICKTIITPSDDNKGAATHYTKVIIVTRESSLGNDAKHILLSACDSRYRLSFFMWDCSVPLLPTDDWFKRPGALQRLFMTSKESLSSAWECSLCVCVCVRAAQIVRQAVLTGMWIVCAQRCDTQCESNSINNVLLGTGTISALCGRTVALLLKSSGQQQRFVLLADNTAALAKGIVDWISFLWV